MLTRMFCGAALLAVLIAALLCSSTAVVAFISGRPIVVTSKKNIFFLTRTTTRNERQERSYCFNDRALSLIARSSSSSLTSPSFTNGKAISSTRLFSSTAASVDNNNNDNNKVGQRKDRNLLVSTSKGLQRLVRSSNNNNNNNCGFLYEAEALYESLWKDHQVLPDAYVVSGMLSVYARAQSIMDRRRHRQEQQQEQQEQDTMTTKAQELLEHAESMGVELNVFCYNSLMNIWAKSKGNDSSSSSSKSVALQKCHDIWTMMKEEGQADVVTYSIMISAYARRGMAEEAECILEEMERNGDQDEKTTTTATRTDVHPDRLAYTSLVDAWAKSDRPDGADRCARIVQKMNDLYESGVEDVSPNAITYSTLINAYARRGMAEEAQSVLDEMDVRGVVPNRMTYSTLMDAWANKSTGKGGAQRCEAILKKMHELNDSGYDFASPDVVTYNTLLNAYAQRGMADDAERIFQDMQDHQVRPDRTSYNSLMDALAKSYYYDRSPSDSNQRAMECEDILRQMQELSSSSSDDDDVEGLEEPDVISYNTLLNAYAHRGMAEDAQRIFDEMDDEKAAEEGHSVVPNIMSYSSLMGAWAKSDRPDGAKECERVMTMMMKQQANLDRNDDDDAISTRIIYNTLLNAYARRGMEVDAQRVFDSIRHPDRTSYNSLMDAWAKSDRDDGVEQAERILMEMQDAAAAADDVCSSSPDVVSYKVLLHAYARRGLEEDAQRIISKMKQAGLEVDEDIRNFEREFTPAVPIVEDKNVMIADDGDDDERRSHHHANRKGRNMSARRDEHRQVHYWTYGGQYGPSNSVDDDGVPLEEISEEIKGILDQRQVARKQRNYAKADELLQVLVSVYGVYVSDKKHEWYFGNPLWSQVTYTQRGGDDLLITAEDRAAILDCIMERHVARRAHDYDLADDIKAHLWNTFGVRVYDDTQEWTVLMKNKHTRKKKKNNNNDMETRNRNESFPTDEEEELMAKILSDAAVVSDEQEIDAVY